MYLSSDLLWSFSRVSFLSLQCPATEVSSGNTEEEEEEEHKAGGGVLPTPGEGDPKVDGTPSSPQPEEPAAETLTVVEVSLGGATWPPF